jgi:hypothetical protein
MNIQILKILRSCSSICFVLFGGFSGLDVSSDPGVRSNLRIHYKVINHLDPGIVVREVVIIFRCKLFQLKNPKTTSNTYNSFTIYNLQTPPHMVIVSMTDLLLKFSYISVV